MSSDERDDVPVTDQLGGAAKEALGRASGDVELEVDGRAQRTGESREQATAHVAGSIAEHGH